MRLLKSWISGNIERKKCNFDMFYSLMCLSELDDKGKNEVADYLGTPQSEFKCY